MSESEGCFGIIRIPHEFILDFFSGVITLTHLPEELKVHSVHENYRARSLDVVVNSKLPIEGYTESIALGATIPEAYIKIVRSAK